MDQASTTHTPAFQQRNNRRRVMPALAVLTALVIAICAALIAPLPNHGPTAEAQTDQPPDRPSGLNTQTLHDQVILTWDNPADASITHYQILRRDRAVHAVGEFATIVSDTGSNATTYTDRTVEPEQSYVYRVKAVNQHGAGESSSYSRADTPAAPVNPTPTPDATEEPKENDQARSDSPPDRPQAPTLAAGDSQITVSWTAPNDGGNPITGYMVQWKRSGQSFNTSRQATDEASPHVITGLANGNTYQVRVIAINDQGNSPPSLQNQATPAGPPNPPENVVLAPMDGELLLAWEEPTHTGSPIIEYTVQWKSFWQQYGTSKQTKTPHDNRLVTIGNLVNDREYTVRIKSRNSLGESPWSAEFTGTPMEPPKARPTGLSFAQIDNAGATATVTFDPNGYQQTMYLRYSKVLVHPLSYTVMSVDVSAASHAVFETTGLRSNTRYYIETSPYPGFEYGDAKVRGYLTTTETAPDVIGFTVEQQSQDTIGLRWQSTRDANKYDLETREDDTSGWTSVPGDFDNLPSTSDYRILRTEVSNLECDTPHHFRLRIRNQGDGSRFKTQWSNHRYRYSIRTTECPQPERITNLTADIEPDCATLRWTPPTGNRHQKYKVVRRASGQETLLNDNWYGNVYNDCSQQYRDGHQHRYTVHALDGSGNEFGEISTPNLTYGPQRAPDAPRNVRLTSDGQQLRILRWDDVNDAWLTGYVVQRRPYASRPTMAHDPGIPGYHLLDNSWTTLQSAIRGNTAETHTDQEDAGSDRYAYRVQACNQAGCSNIDVFNNFDWAFMAP